MDQELSPVVLHNINQRHVSAGSVGLEVVLQSGHTSKEQRIDILKEKLEILLNCQHESRHQANPDLNAL